MSENYVQHEYDVVVIGAGGAGLRAAIEAARSGAKTAIITKSLLGKAFDGRRRLPAALQNAVKGLMESSLRHYEGSKWLADWQMAEYHAKEAQTESEN